MKKPRERRTLMKLPVRVWGMDSAGKLFSIEASTVDITPRGACLEGVVCMLQRGAIIGVECGRSRARFRIAWIGRPGSDRWPDWRPVHRTRQIYLGSPLATRHGRR